MTEASSGNALPAEAGQASMLAPIPLYEGPLQVQLEGGLADGHATVTFEWRPSPRVRIHFESDETSLLHSFGDLLPEEAFIFPDLEDWPSVQQPAPAIPSSGIRWTQTFPLSKARSFGDANILSRMRISAINFVHWDLPHYEILPDQGRRSVLPMEVEGWHVDIRSLHKAIDLSQRINDMGGYAITHEIEIRRTDEGTFSVEDTKLLRGCLFLAMSFVKGANVGLALPEGYNADGERIRLEWSTTIVDSWSTRLTWCDPGCVGGLEQVLRGWVHLARDEFWRVVLMRAARALVSANQGDPLDAAIPIAATALEMLAWAILVRRHRWLMPEDNLPESSRTRLMLRWAGIPTAIPPELVHLPVFITGVAQADRDVAHGIWQTRNRLVHPPTRQSQDWPSMEVMEDAWRIELEILELLILRLVGYTGHYGDRRHFQGRLREDTEPVPWTT